MNNKIMSYLTTGENPSGYFSEREVRLINETVSALNLIRRRDAAIEDIGVQFPDDDSYIIDRKGNWTTMSSMIALYENQRGLILNEEDFFSWFPAEIIRIFSAEEMSLPAVYEHYGRAAAVRWMRKVYSIDRREAHRRVMNYEEAHGLPECLKERDDEPHIKVGGITLMRNN